jgi:deoxyribonuclease V
MKVNKLHEWQMNLTQAREMQLSLASRVMTKNEGIDPPLILDACEKLCNTPDIILVDGQGIAHPRRLGLASHLGLFLDTPTIGCAKSILCGRHEPVGDSVGSHAELVDNGEIIGAALRTRVGVKPIYVSIGHKIDLASALYWVAKCCRGYRLPEPTRLAHFAAGGKLVSQPGYQEKLFG